MPQKSEKRFKKAIQQQCLLCKHPPAEQGGFSKNKLKNKRDLVQILHFFHSS
jgi:hypothetical protein